MVNHYRSVEKVIIITTVSVVQTKKTASEIYVSDEQQRLKYEEIIKIVIQIESQFKIKWTNVVDRFIYIKLIIQRENILKVIGEGDFDSEEEREEYEEFIKKIQEIEVTVGIKKLVKNIKIQYIEYLKIILYIYETFGMKFKSQVEIMEYEKILRQIQILEQVKIS